MGRKNKKRDREPNKSPDPGTNTSVEPVKTLGEIPEISNPTGNQEKKLTSHENEIKLEEFTNTPKESSSKNSSEGNHTNACTSPVSECTVNQTTPKDKKIHVPMTESEVKEKQVKLHVDKSEDQPREKSRVVFVATACHTCKAVPDNVNIKLSLCAGCRMVNYCSRSHQVADWKTHKPLCTLIDKVLKAEQKTYLYDRCKENLSQTKWLQVRYGYMQLFRDQLGRELHPYEKELLLFPRVCRACRLVHSLQTCSTCNMSSYCANHDTLRQHDWCADLKVWLDLVRWESENGLVRSSKGPETASRISDIISDFPSDIRTFFGGQSFPEDMNRECEGVWLAGITDVATVPLTIIWTLIEFAPHLLSSESLTVHLIGAEMDFEGCCAAKWETCFVHLVTGLRKLNIILIGPELVSAPLKHNLCSQCEKKNVKVVFEHHTGLMYHEYCDDSETEFLAPDIICAFNCGIYRSTGFDGEDSWAPTIPLLGKALLVTTAYTETECFQDIRRVTDECKDLRVVGSCLKNPYRSLRPQRTLINEEIEPLMYKNQYVAVYKPVI